jgi:hypothetical protein
MNSPAASSSPAKTPQQLADDLAQFTGTEGYHRYWVGGLLLTDGVRYLADQAGCYWLLDAIGCYQSQLAKHPDQRLHEMQFWKLEVKADKSAVLTCVADSGEPAAISQQIVATDFPLPEIQIWVAVEGERRTALLPSEY